MALDSGLSVRSVRSWNFMTVLQGHRGQIVSEIVNFLFLFNYLLKLPLFLEPKKGSIKL